MEAIQSDLSPSSMPFDSYIRGLPLGTTAPVGAACAIHECIAIAKRILLQERVRDFGASDVVALAAIIANLDREITLNGSKK